MVSTNLYGADTPDANTYYQDDSNTTTWSYNTFGNTASDDVGMQTKSPQLERWVYATANSEITLSDRLEKSNWETDCSRL
jgi:hypothetical protein